MNKKIFISLAIISVVSVIAIGGTIAYFSDVETSAGNTLSASTIDLTVNGQNPFSSAVIALYDVKPSEDLPTIYVNLRNAGTNEGIADLHIGTGQALEGIESESECEAEGKIWNEELAICEGEEILNENICEEFTYRYCYDSHRDWACDPKDYQGEILPSQDIDLGILGSGTRRLWLTPHLKEETGNEYQGDTCIFNIDFTLHQIMPD